MNTRAACLTIAVCLHTAPTADAELVTLRSTGEHIEGAVGRFDEQTLVLLTPTDDEAPPDERPIAWTDVRSIDPIPAPTSKLAIARQRGDDVWRANKRLERGDVAGALRLLDPHTDELIGRSGAVSAAWAEGVLACRLWLGDWPGATAAWVALLASGGADVSVPWLGYDDQSGVVTHLPPLFTSASSAKAFESATELLTSRIAPDTRAGVLLALYLDAAASSAALDGGADSGVISRVDLIRTIGRDETVLFVSDIVAACAANPETRADARARLNALRERRPERWVEAWAGVAISRSLGMEDADDQRQLAVVEAIDIALRHESDAPVLAGIAWYDAARIARAAGDDRTARLLEAELNARFPDHPAARAGQPRDPEGTDS